MYPFPDLIFNIPCNNTMLYFGTFATVFATQQHNVFTQPVLQRQLSPGKASM